MKKRIIGLLVLCLAAGGLSSCGGKKENGDNSKTAVIKWVVPAAGQPDTNIVLDEANKIISEKIDGTLSLEFVDDGAYTERMNMYMASGNDFDLCFTGYVNPYLQAAQKGGLKELDELVKTTPQLVETMTPELLETCKVNGKLYAIPNLQILASSQAVGINRGLADKYGFDMTKVKRTEDIEPYLAKIKQSEPSLFPFNTHWGVTSFNWSDEAVGITNHLVAFKQPDGSFKVENMYAQPEYKKYVRLLRSWYEKGYIRKDVASVLDDSNTRYAFSVCMYKPGLEGESIAAGDEQVYAQVTKPVFMGAGNAMTAIGRKSKNPEKAIKLLELVNTDKNLFNMLAFGIENRNYKKTGDDSIEYIENSGYEVRAAWKFGNQFLAYTLPGQAPDVWEQTKQYNASAVKKTVADGFTIDTAPFKTLISQIETVVNTYSCINNGSENPDVYYETFLKKLDEAGINTMAEGCEKQINDYIKGADR